MALQLLACFEYCGIEFTGINDQILAELKKTLLLDLKASGSDTIVIDGEAYSKNDILEFFERQDFIVQTQSSDPAATQTEAPSAAWHSVLSRPEALTTFFEIPDELLDRDKLEEARRMVEQVYGKGIIREAQRQFRDGEYDRLLYILSYAPVFSNAFSYDLKQALYLLFKNQMLKIGADTQQQLPLDIKATVFFNKGFYQTIHFLKDLDGDIMRQIMRVAVERSKGQNLSWETKKELFEQFFQLPLDADGEAYIKKNLDYFDERMRDEEAETTRAAVTQQQRQASYINQQSKMSSAGRVIVTVLAVIAGIFFAGMIISRNISTDTKEKDQSVSDMIKEMQQMAESGVDYYFETDDVIRDYKELKSSIETNVTHPEMSAFLVNVLSRFCYNQDADSTQNRLSFIPIQPVPECIPMTFSNDSKISEVLVLFYDEENPEAPVRGKLIPKNVKYENFTLYIRPTERTVVIFDPVIENGNTVVASVPASVDVFNVLFESYRLKSASPQKDVHLSCSEYDENDVMLTHIYETMEVKRLYTKPKGTY